MAISLFTVVCVGRHDISALQIHHSMHQAQEYPVESVILIWVAEVFSAQLWWLWQFGAAMDQVSLFPVHYCEASKGYLSPSWSLLFWCLQWLILETVNVWECFCGCFTYTERHIMLVLILPTPAVSPVVVATVGTVGYHARPWGKITGMNSYCSSISTSEKCQEQIT